MTPLQADESLEQQLADRYAPIVYLRQVNRDMCSSDNEGFDPITVDFVLGREEIPLRTSESGRPSGPLRTVVEAPSGRDMFGLDQPHFLDFPGSPVRPRCDYRRYYAGRLANEEFAHVAYAHLYLEPGEDQLALQYWLFYYFNDWNNVHEGDWEMIMLIFDASTVEEALEGEPIRTVFAQHSGGERADWDGGKLSKEDGRPVVYVARGAHASFYEPGVYFGLAEQGTGFGCETTRGPHRRIALSAVVVPHEPSGPDSAFPWLAYTGRWGEFRRSEWNGPTGPNVKRSWTEPITWADSVRDTSLVVPDFEGYGQAPIDLFCGLVSAGSRALVAFTRTPTLAAGIVGIVVVAVGWFFTYTSGTVHRAVFYYRCHLTTFVLIGAALTPIGYLVAGLQTLLFRVPPIEPFIAIMDRFPGIRIILILTFGSFQVTIAALFVTPTVIWTMAQIHQGQSPSVIEAYRHGLRAIPPIFIARVIVALRIIVYAVTIVGLPWAILRAVRSFFIPQAVVYDQRAEPGKAFLRSSDVANANLRRTALIQAILAAVTLLTGPIVAIFVLLVIPSRPLWLVNYVSTFIFTLVYPIGAIGMTLLYLDLQTDRDA